MNCRDKRTYKRASRRPLSRPPVRKGKRKGGSIALLSVIGIVATALLVMARANPDVARTSEGCRADGVLPAIQVWQLDATEIFTRAEAERVAAEIKRSIAELPVEGKVTITALQPGGKGGASRYLFSRCKPRDGSKANPWWENGRLLRQHYRESFAGPLEEVLESLTILGDADTSPLLEYHYAEVSAFEKNVDGSKRLVIVSDGLEFSSLANFYRPYSWDRIRRHPKVSAMKDRLQGVEVTLLLRLHPMPTVYQGARHEAFWRAYFEYAGVTILQISPL